MFFHILDKAAVGIPEREILWNIYIRFELNFTLAYCLQTELLSHNQYRLYIENGIISIKGVALNQFYILFNIHTSHFWMDTTDWT